MINVYDIDFCNEKYSYFFLAEEGHNEIGRFIVCTLSVYNDDSNIVASIDEAPVYSCKNKYYVVFNLIGNIIKRLKDNEQGRFAASHLKESRIELFKMLDEEKFFDDNRLLQAVKDKFVTENNL